MKLLFWATDCQKDFMNKNGKLYVSGAEDIKDNLEILTELARKNNIKVINTQDWHTKTDKEISVNPDFKTTFPKHCMAGTNGAEFISETYPKNFEGNYYIVNYYDTKLNLDKLHRSRNIIIFKDKFDVFEGNDLSEEVLDNINPNIVIVYGVATNVCVDFAVQGLVSFRGYEVKVVVDAIQELPDTIVEDIYDVWEQKGVKLITMKEVISLTE